MMTEINLGDVAEDSITGFQGVVIAITKWLHGCRRVSLKPTRLKDGQPMDAMEFDEPQLIIIKQAQYTTTGYSGLRRDLLRELKERNENRN